MKKPIMLEGKMVQKIEQYFKDKNCLKAKFDSFKIKLFSSCSQWLLIYSTKKIMAYFNPIWISSVIVIYLDPVEIITIFRNMPAKK